MTVTKTALEQIDHHWAVQAVGDDNRKRVFDVVHLHLVKAAYGSQLGINESASSEDLGLLERLATAYELAAIEGLRALLHPSTNEDHERLREQAQAGAFRAFEIRRTLPLPIAPEQRIFEILHLCSLAYCGDRWADIRRWLKEHTAEATPPSVADASWDLRLVYRLYDCWVRLLRKDRWDDLDGVREIVAGLREDQKRFEPQLLGHEHTLTSRSNAVRLIALYHWAKATELLAVYMLQGEPRSISTELDQHFEAAREAATTARDHLLDVLLQWLHVAARRMAAGSVWWVAHAVNSRVTRFVSSVTKTRSLFELLPPQRVALQEQGLLDQAAGAVVVEMPTSGGKTVLAQFRILQALNQFDVDHGWVAYVAPTRALVSQITRRLRADFNPLGINVEQLSSAVEIDSFEDALLSASDREQSFKVLVVTPEKLHLVIRNKKVERPLALVVMDEAHNIEDEERGLRIELLLATIKRDCPSANFLLLMPFVPNAKDLARWLAPETGKAISLGTTAWQPNERVVGMYSIEKVETETSRKGDWLLRFETLTTTPGTIELRGTHQAGGIRPLKIPYSKAKTLTNQTGAMAKIFSARGGTSIAVAQTIPDVWAMARQLKANTDPLDEVSSEIALVQRFLATEISPQFELIDLLNHGIGVHHAGLSDEIRSLVEWLAEDGKLRILCATSTISQGINFPVSSVFLATRNLPAYPPKEMSSRAFWNLAGRAGRIGQDSVGLVALAAGNDPDKIREFVSARTGDLVSRLVEMLNELEKLGQLNNLSTVIQQEQWADFRRYVAHLWNEKKQLDAVLADTEQLLRNTYGYGTLQSSNDLGGLRKARALLDATRSYARTFEQHPENAALADSTGFSPEGVRSAIIELNQLQNRLNTADWQPQSIFGNHNQSTLPQLIGVMMRIPELRKSLEALESGAHGSSQTYISDVAKAWVSGSSIEEIAKEYFGGKNVSPEEFTDAISKTCKGIYRVLGNVGTWGISALSKMPTSGINFDSLSEEQRRQINNLPAMLYHGVDSEAAVLMRMNFAPRSISKSLGNEFLRITGTPTATPQEAREFLRTLDDLDWGRLAPERSQMSGADYKAIWSKLSGEA